MTATVLAIETIASDPAVRGGRPIVAGTSICVMDLAAYYVYGGRTPEELAVGFNLTLAQVHAALAYYHMHKDEIDAAMRADADHAEQLAQALAGQGRVMRFG